MKPFQIQCTTCSTLLRVTKPEAIGMILGCPKCNSMVQIVAPEGWVIEPISTKSEVSEPKPSKAQSNKSGTGKPADGVKKSSVPTSSLLSASSSQPAVTNSPPIPTTPQKKPTAGVAEAKSGLATPTDVRRSEPPKNSGKTASQQSASQLPASPQTKTPPTVSRVAKTAVATAPVAALPPTSATTLPSIAEPPVAQPPVVNGATVATAREGISLLVPTIGAVALVMTIGVSWWLLGQLQDDPRGTAVAVTQPKQPATSTDDPLKKVPVENGTDKKQPVVVVDVNSPDNPFAPRNNVDQPADPANPLPIAIPGAAPLGLGVANGQANPDKPKENPADPAVQAQIDQFKNSFQPADNSPPAGVKPQPGKLVLGPTEEPTVKPQQGIASAVKPPVTQGEKKDPDNNLVASIEPQAFPAAPDNSNVQKINAASPELERIAYVDLDPSSLDMTLGGVSYENVPLYRVLEEISDMSRIPLHIDLKALEQNGVSVVMPVRFKATNITVRNVLDRVLEPFGLALIEHAHYMIVGQVERLPAPTSSRYNVDDLAKDEQQIQADLISPIKRLVAPESWAKANVETQEKTLIVTQTFDVHDQIVTWCEKLRKARGLPLQTKYDPAQPMLRRFNPARYEPSPEWAVAKSALAKKVTAGYPRPEAIGSILKHLEQQSGTAIIVDHAALDFADFSPASTGTLTVRDSSLDEALSKLLTPLGLGFTPIDDQTIVVSTLKELTTKSLIEWYPLQPLMAKNVVPVEVEKVVPWLNQELKKSESANVVAPELCHWDAASRTLVIKGSALLHRDLARVLNL